MMLGYYDRTKLLRRPIILFVLGAIFGIGFYSTFFEKESITNNNLHKLGCVKESGTLLARLVHLTRRFPSVIIPTTTTTIASTTRSNNNNNDKRTITSAVPTIITSSKVLFKNAPFNTRQQQQTIPMFEPSETTKTFYMPCGKKCAAFCRALRSLGWTKVNVATDAQLVFTDMMKESKEKNLTSYQRYNHMPSRLEFTPYKTFWNTIQQYRTDVKALHFIPDTYRLNVIEERQELERRIEENKNKPWWVVWQKNEISTIAQNFKMSDHFLVSQYICNQMAWSDGNPFLIRVYWLVASVDPLLVFYQDGFVRIGYNQTNTHVLKNDRDVVTMEELETYLLKKKDKTKYKQHTNNVLVHIRNQIKSSLAQLVDVFKENSFQPTKDREDGFELFCTDFVLTENLDVMLWHSPYSDTFNGAAYSMGLEDYYWLMEKNHELFYSTMTIITEVWNKQLLRREDNTADATNFLPMENTGMYQMIYVKNVKEKEAAWKFEYDYTPTNNKNKKQQCTPTWTRPTPIVNYFNSNPDKKIYKNKNLKQLNIPKLFFDEHSEEEEMTSSMKDDNDDNVEGREV